MRPSAAAEARFRAFLFRSRGPPLEPHVRSGDATGLRRALEAIEPAERAAAVARLHPSSLAPRAARPRRAR